MHSVEISTSTRGPLNRRSLGFARDDKGEGGASMDEPERDGHSLWLSRPVSDDRGRHERKRRPIAVALETRPPQERRVASTELAHRIFRAGQGAHAVAPG